MGLSAPSAAPPVSRPLCTVPVVGRGRVIERVPLLDPQGHPRRPTQTPLLPRDPSRTWHRPPQELASTRPPPQPARHPRHHHPRHRRPSPPTTNEPPVEPLSSPYQQPEIRPHQAQLAPPLTTHEVARDVGSDDPSACLHRLSRQRRPVLLECTSEGVAAQPVRSQCPYRCTDCRGRCFSGGMTRFIKPMFVSERQDDTFLVWKFTVPVFLSYVVMVDGAGIRAGEDGFVNQIGKATVTQPACAVQRGRFQPESTEP